MTGGSALYLQLVLELLDGRGAHHTVPVAVVLHVELSLGEGLHAQRLAQRLNMRGMINSANIFNASDTVLCIVFFQSAQPPH